MILTKGECQYSPPGEGHFPLQQYFLEGIFVFRRDHHDSISKQFPLQRREDAGSLSPTTQEIMKPNPPRRGSSL